MRILPYRRCVDLRFRACSSPATFLSFIFLRQALTPSNGSVVNIQSLAIRLEGSVKKTEAKDASSRYRNYSKLPNLKVSLD